MLKEGRHFAKIADNIVVKVPMSETGLEAISRFAAEGISTNCTLIFTANQGLLAAKAGASLLSPFVGRLDDINEEGMVVIRELSDIIRFHELESEVLSASIRHPPRDGPRSPAPTSPRCRSRSSSRWSTTRSRTRASPSSAPTGTRPARRSRPPSTDAAATPAAPRLGRGLRRGDPCEGSPSRMSSGPIGRR